MNILALTKYSYEGPSSRYRFYNYKKCFEKKGINMTIKPFFSKSYFTSRNKIEKLFIVLKSYIYRFLILINLLIFKRKYKLILIEYELFPYFPAIFEYLLKKRGIKYIVDYDDAIFHKYDISNNKIINFLLEDKIAKVIQNASYVIACNQYLENYIKKYNTNILRLPTVVLLDKYIQQMENFNKDKNSFVIGWIGSKTTSIYILEILPSIKKIITKYPNIEFNLIGFDKNLLLTQEIKSHNINIIPWREENEIENILNFDIGIMPLHNDPWSRGKCGFKLIQYMSCKKPVIASPVGINCSLVENNKNGFLVENLDEWFNAFEKLCLDKNLRVKMAENNFKKVVKSFNYNRNCQEYISLIINM
jgi:glycosyltransferase involved in cell wall biosynthesis